MAVKKKNSALAINRDGFVEISLNRLMALSTQSIVSQPLFVRFTKRVHVPSLCKCSDCPISGQCSQHFKPSFLSFWKPSIIRDSASVLPSYTFFAYLWMPTWFLVGIEPLRVIGCSLHRVVSMDITTTSFPLITTNVYVDSCDLVLRVVMTSRPVTFTNTTCYPQGIAPFPYVLLVPSD